MAVVRTGEALLRGIDLGRAREVVDRVADRIAAMDPAAEELAQWTESLVATHGRERVLRAVLLRNMLIDGTFLEFFETLLSGGDPEALPSPEALARARTSCLRLVDTLAGIEGESFASLRASGALPLTGEHLEGRSDDAAFHRFCLWSYTLFLQSFLLRSVVETTTELMATLRPGLSEDASPIDVEVIASARPDAEHR